MRAPPALGNPRRMLRVLEAVFGGVRRPASIARLLDVDVRVVRAYIAHATWIGLARDAPEPHLTGLGLEFVLASRLRADVMARAVAAHPVLSAGTEIEAIEIALLQAGISASAALARRDARAVRRLVEGAKRARADAPDAQLSFSFPGPLPDNPRGAGAESGEDSLDIYAWVLRGLLEHGELSLATLRGLLDAAGAENAGIGAYAALAVRRKDATRRGETLVVTAGAVQRFQLSESAVSIALSDPDFRVWLEGGSVAPGEQGRCQRWGRRLFGAKPVAEALSRLLFGRRLASFPLAGEAGQELPPPTGAFADAIANGPVAFALPRTVSTLDAGLSWVHTAWRGAVMAPAAARVPGVLDGRIVVYGGLFSPGEAVPRNIPDLLSLRLRAVRNIPALTLLAAAGDLHRHKLLRLRDKGDTVWVETPGRTPVTFDELLDIVAKSRGWVISRGPARSPWPTIVATAVKLGILVRSRDLVTIDETFFMRLGSDPEHHELHERLAAPRDALESALGKLRSSA